MTVTRVFMLLVVQLCCWCASMSQCDTSLHVTGGTTVLLVCFNESTCVDQDYTSLHVTGGTTVLLVCFNESTCVDQDYTFWHFLLCFLTMNKFSIKTWFDEIYVIILYNGSVWKFLQVQAFYTLNSLNVFFIHNDKNLYFNFSYCAYTICILSSYSWRQIFFI